MKRIQRFYFYLLVAGLLGLVIFLYGILPLSNGKTIFSTVFAEVLEPSIFNGISQSPCDSPKGEYWFDFMIVDEKNCFHNLTRKQLDSFLLMTTNPNEKLHIDPDIKVGIGNPDPDPPPLNIQGEITKKKKWVGSYENGVND